MENDTKDKILRDWNKDREGQSNYFDKFDDLFKHIKRISKEQGDPKRKENPYLKFDESFHPNKEADDEMQTWAKGMARSSTTDLLLFRKRIKALKEKID